MRKKIKHLTNCFLIKESGSKITEVCLAMKKRGLGAGKWNGSGGKLENGEFIKEATIREVREELTVDATYVKKVGILRFISEEDFEEDLVCHVFFCDKWVGKPSETEEMAPKWFEVSNIPYSKMWVTDKYWLKLVLEGKKVQATFWFRDSENLRKFEVKEVGKISKS